MKTSKSFEGTELARDYFSALANLQPFDPAAFEEGQLTKMLSRREILAEQKSRLVELAVRGKTLKLWLTRDQSKDYLGG